MIYIDAPADCPLNGECFIPKIIQRADASDDENSNKKFFSVQQTQSSKKGTETKQGALNMKSMRIAPNWSNIPRS